MPRRLSEIEQIERQRFILRSLGYVILDPRLDLVYGVSVVLRNGQRVGHGKTEIEAIKFALDHARQTRGES